MAITNVIRRHRTTCMVRASALAIGLLVSSFSGVMADTAVTSCLKAGTPTGNTSATPEVLTPHLITPSTDEAFLGIYDRFLLQSIEAAAISSERLERPEVLAFAQQQVAIAAADIEMLASFPISVGASSFGSQVNVIETLKMELDLPAGVGGEESFGIVSGLETLCYLDGPSDDIYLALVADLAQQKIDLAQVAAVFGSEPRIVAFAQVVIDREAGTIGSVFTLLEARSTPEATPAPG